MRIGELAERAGVNIETLRYYERRGLLPEPARGPSGHRRYDEDALRFVREAPNQLMDKLGMEWLEVGRDRIVARIPVAGNTQPSWSGMPAGRFSCSMAAS